MGRAARLLLAFAAISILAFVSVWAVRAGWANSLTLFASRDINAWFASRASPAFEPWMAARRTLQEASRLSPGDPAPQEMLGVLHLLRTRPEYAELALDNYVKAITRRPAWPHSWGSVVEARFRLGRLDPPFEQILVRSYLLGPNQPDVQREVVLIGMNVWDRLGPEARKAVTAAIGASMRADPLITMEIAEKRRRLDLVCPLVAGEARLAKTKWPAACGL